jgi:hypothetical protein
LDLGFQARSRAFNKDEKLPGMAGCQKQGQEAEKLTGAFVLYSHITHVVHLCARDIPLVAPRIETFTIIQ